MRVHACDCEMTHECVSHVQCVRLEMSGIATLYMCIQLSCTGCYLYVSTVCMTTHCTQGYQKVPETPLASCQVLRDEAEVWMDVQVGQLYTK